MKAETPKIILEIKSGEPTPGQLRQWSKLWQKLLSKGQGQEQAKDEAAADQGQAKVSNEGSGPCS